MHYSSPTADRMIFRDELARLADKHESLVLHEQHTDTDGMLELAELDRICPDWQERETWACGPAPMLDAITEHFETTGLEEQLHVERFSLALGGDGGEGGTLTFAEHRQDRRRRRRHDGARGRRGGRDRHAVRLPDGHLPHLHDHQGVRHHARPAQR